MAAVRPDVVLLIVRVATLAPERFDPFRAEEMALTADEREVVLGATVAELRAARDHLELLRDSVREQMEARRG